MELRLGGAAEGTGQARAVLSFRRHAASPTIA
jgi:hypothetical protein